MTEDDPVDMSRRVIFLATPMYGSSPRATTSDTVPCTGESTDWRESRASSVVSPSLYRVHTTLDCASVERNPVRPALRISEPAAIFSAGAGAVVAAAAAGVAATAGAMSGPAVTARVS